ncbi:nuclease-related domain-containing protein [Salimicrobium halophilum]|nr:nuclease-related domain-containing protein [Salimicrobium halophilum]
MKERQPPFLMKVLQALERRKILNEKEETLKRRLVKGWHGELIFDQMMKELPDHMLILKDLNLKHKGSKFQIDTVVIESQCVHLYEVKYHEGNYFYKDNEFQLSSGKGILNPFHQSSRARTLLTQLLEDHDFFVPVKAHVIFPHPHFYLYQAPKLKEFIFLSQWKDHFTELIQNTSSIPNRLQPIADLLCSKHREQFSSEDSPVFHYDQLKKDVFCPHCSSVIRSETRTFMCDNCELRSTTEMVLLQAVEDLRVLFPKRRITTPLIHEWCKGKISKKRIQRVLSKNFEKAGIGRGIHYF